MDSGTAVSLPDSEYGSTSLLEGRTVCCVFVLDSPLCCRNLSLNGLSDDERCSVGHLDWGECSTDDAGQYDLVLGSDVVYPKEGLPASLAAAALGSLRRDAKARLYIMQHGSYMQGVAGAVQDKEGRSFHTRDGWKEFCDMLSEEVWNASLCDSLFGFRR